MRDADFAFICLAGLKVGGYRGREGELAGLGKVVEGVCFASVLVIHLNAAVWGRVGDLSGGLDRLGGYEGFIEEAIESAVLSLCYIKKGLMGCSR